MCDEGQGRDREHRAPAEALRRLLLAVLVLGSTAVRSTVQGMGEGMRVWLGERGEERVPSHNTCCIGHMIVPPPASMLYDHHGDSYTGARVCMYA